ncbi:hypothetical protein FQA39_LY03999 [Lamprigera yunnana]|nr:hypothetical protein FQA39_LY03999 [Lamprigera yunnana]
MITDDEDFGWWSKYYASLDGPTWAYLKTKKPMAPNVGLTQIRKFPIHVYVMWPLCVIHPLLREFAKAYNSSPSILQLNLYHPHRSSESPYHNTTKFRMCKHKNTGDGLFDELNVKATLKASIQIYRIPLDSEENYLTPYGHPLSQGVYSHFFSNEPTKFLVRIYCVRGVNLHAKDVNGFIPVRFDGKAETERRRELRAKTGQPDFLQKGLLPMESLPNTNANFKGLAQNI